MFDLNQHFQLMPTRRRFVPGTINPKISQVLGTDILAKWHGTTILQECDLTVEAIVSATGEPCLLNTKFLWVGPAWCAAFRFWLHHFLHDDALAPLLAWDYKLRGDGYIPGQWYYFSPIHRFCVRSSPPCPHVVYLAELVLNSK